MEGEAPSRRGVMKSRRSILLFGLFHYFPGMFQGLRSRLGDNSEETEVAGSLVGSPEAPKAPNLALSNHPLVSQAEQNFLKKIEKMTQLMG
ncbi:hypothetical protein O181_036521 [Austropuccinia psidii MF-1]|uniref:Uncharacterized protein n=1 Tax=Austropuccinia psidii MF-1 TaxID=1389203 RepID=A0A9Q3DAC7_9BASI|nr:hypothetical protein [Austropuccinia psidii MF-1]